ncbi:MAG: hypothetical protein GWO23_25710 [Gammaproteobacteria bacterium]|nr:hypothetical protein [Gammaproteobacteria bacterium]
MHGFGIGGWLLGLLGLLFFIALAAGAIIAIVWAVRQVQGNQSSAHPQGQSTPESILKSRYAHGEITREEYLAMLEDLRD